MDEHKYKEWMRHNLPHFHPPGATLFVTFRLVNSIPQHRLRTYRAEKLWLEHELARLSKPSPSNRPPDLQGHLDRIREFHRRWFAEFEQTLDRAETGSAWLAQPPIAEIVTEALRYRDGRVYCLEAYCVMPNHVHTVFTPFLSEQELRAEVTNCGLRYFSPHPGLDKIMQFLKSRSARKANLAIGRDGPFWQEESYDHVVRDAAEFSRIVRYVLNNPVKAGFVKSPCDWPWSYLRAGGTADWQSAENSIAHDSEKQDGLESRHV